MSERLALDGGTPTVGDEHSWLRPGAAKRNHKNDGRSSLSFLLGRSPDPEERPSRGYNRAVSRLERRWVDATGRPHAMIVRSGALAARVALRSVGVGPGDEVLFPAGSFFVNPEATNGATAIQVDLDPHTLQIDVEAVRAAITSKTTAIVALDSFGTTPDYGALLDIANRHGVALIEDATGAIGATYGTLPAGSFGSVSFASLGMPGPVSSSSQGGVVSTSSFALRDSAQRHLAGAARPGIQFTAASVETNRDYQLDDEKAEAAEQILAQSERLASVRAANGYKLVMMLAEIPGIWTPSPRVGTSQVFSTFPILVQTDELGLPEHTAPVVRDVLRDCARAEGLWLDTWNPEPIGGNDLRDGACRSSVTTELDVYIRQQKELPVADAMAESCVVLGRGSSPFDSAHTHGPMEVIASCLRKILVTNVDRFRSIVNERLDLVTRY